MTTINKLYKAIMNQDIDNIKKIIGTAYKFTDNSTICLTFNNSRKIYKITVEHGLYSYTSLLNKLPITQEIFDWVSLKLFNN